MANEITVGESERWVSTILGGMLVLSSLRRRDATAGAAFALGGAALLYRGLTGRDGMFRSIRRALSDELRRGGSLRLSSGSPGAPGGRSPNAPAPDHDEVDEASMESFPASDAPSWTP